jgi:hypothetical protein
MKSFLTTEKTVWVRTFPVTGILLVCLFVCLFVCLCVCLFVCLFACLFVLAFCYCYRCYCCCLIIIVVVLTIAALVSLLHSRTHFALVTWTSEPKVVHFTKNIDLYKAAHWARLQPRQFGPTANRSGCVFVFFLSSLWLFLCGPVIQFAVVFVCPSFYSLLPFFTILTSIVSVKVLDSWFLDVLYLIFFSSFISFLRRNISHIHFMFVDFDEFLHIKQKKTYHCWAEILNSV